MALGSAAAAAVDESVLVGAFGRADRPLLLLPDACVPERKPARRAPSQRPRPKPLLRVGPISWTLWKAQTPSSSCTYK